VAGPPEACCALACGRVFEKSTRPSQMIMFLIRC